MIKYLILLFLLVPYSAQAAAFYGDFGTTTGGGAGTASTTSYGDLNQFVNVARNPGDIIFLRNSTASTTNVLGATFLSDGTLNTPIYVSRDLDNIWSGFTTPVETATPVFGATTITLSASSTIGTDNWVYFGTDCVERYNPKTINPCALSNDVYQVASTTIGSANNILTLYLPYNGDMSGAGVAIRNVGKAPIIGTVALNTIIMAFSADDYWFIYGLDMRGTNAGCVIGPSATRGTIFNGVVLQGNGVTDCGVGSSLDGSMAMNSFRIFGALNGFNSGPSGGILNDFIIDCNNVASSIALNTNGARTEKVMITNGKIINCVRESAVSTNASASFLLRNVQRPNTPLVLSGSAHNVFYYEDDYGIVGLNRTATYQIQSNEFSTTTQSTTTVLRSGGGPVSMAVYPPSGTGNTGISTNYFPFSYMKLLDVPFYSDTSSKTYTVWAMSTSTANFVVDPLTATATSSSTPEFYIECEYYGHATNASRLLKKSNTAAQIDFNGSTAWQSISVTCQPVQAGVNYIRVWYAKPSDGFNAFIIDPTIVVS